MEHLLPQEMEMESMEVEESIGKRQCAVEQRDRGQVMSTTFIGSYSLPSQNSSILDW